MREESDFCFCWKKQTSTNKITKDEPVCSTMFQTPLILLNTVQEERICLFTLDSTQEIYIPSDSQESSLQIYTHIFSLEVKMLEKLTDLNWR